MQLFAKLIKILKVSVTLWLFFVLMIKNRGKRDKKEQPSSLAAPLKFTYFESIHFQILQNIDIFNFFHTGLDCSFIHWNKFVCSLRK